MAVKERPILFSGPMVRAIQDGPKTQTRRVVKSSRSKFTPCLICVQEGTAHNVEDLKGNVAGAIFGEDPYLRVGYCEHNEVIGERIRCPYGVPGDRLWVRETWRVEHHVDHMKPSSLNPLGHYAVDYLADGTNPEWAGKTRPSIFIPRWASRIDLGVTAVRVERVQDISEEDALAEGVDPGCGTCGEKSLPSGCGCNNPEPLPQDAFIYLWDTINAKRGPEDDPGAYAWDRNPWVWVIEWPTYKKELNR